MTVQTLPSAPSSALVPGYLMPGPERARHWLGQLLVFIGITGIVMAPVAHRLLHSLHVDESE